MRIALINPSVRLGSRYLSEDSISGNLINYMGEFQPLGLLYIAAALREAGYSDIHIIDAQAENLLPGQAAMKAAQLKPDVVGIYCLTFSFLYALELARELKKKSSAVVVAGGPHLGIYPQEALSHRSFDFGAAGEGEHLFLRLVRLLEERRREEINSLPGIVYRKGAEVIVNPAQTIEELDLLPLPARDLLLHERYFRNYRDSRFTSLLSTRGCPYRCGYCSHPLHYDRTRFRSPEKVIEEIEHCISTFGTRCFQFFDDTFLLDKGRVLEICRLIKKRRLKIDYLLSTRVDLLDEELAEAMSETGCSCISLGVESGDQGVLDYLEKGISVEQSRRAIGLCRKHNIDSVTFMMVGAPPETEESIKNTFDFVREANPRWLKTNVLVAYPGSPLYTKLIREGRITDFWREMTLKGEPPEIPNICMNFTKRQLRKICSKLNLVPYLRIRSNFFNLRRLIYPKNAVWSLRWFFRSLFNLAR